MGKHRPFLTVAVGVMLALPSSPAAAQSEDIHVAAALFDAGTQKMKSGGCEKAPVTDRALCEEAIDAFHRAHRAYPGSLGSLKNAALLEKNLGRTASAVRDLRALAIAASDDPRPERREWATLAREEIATLLPRVPHLRVGVPSPPPPGLEVRIDSVPLIAAAWNTFVEVDPGRHTITMTSGQRAPMTREVVLDAGGEARIELSDAQPTANADPRSASSSDHVSPSRPSGIAPAIVIGVGAVTTMVGLVFGGLAIKTHGDVCDEANVCEPDGLDRGRSYAMAANVMVGAGLVVGAAGVLWYVLARRDAPASRPSTIGPSRTTAVFPLSFRF